MHRQDVYVAFIKNGPHNILLFHVQQHCIMPIDACSSRGRSGLTSKRSVSPNVHYLTADFRPYLPTSYHTQPKTENKRSTILGIKYAIDLLG